MPVDPGSTLFELQKAYFPGKTQENDRFSRFSGKTGSRALGRVRGAGSAQTLLGPRRGPGAPLLINVFFGWRKMWPLPLSNARFSGGVRVFGIFGPRGPKIGPGIPDSGGAKIPHFGPQNRPGIGVGPGPAAGPGPGGGSPDRLHRLRRLARNSGRTSCAPGRADAGTETRMRSAAVLRKKQQAIC